MLNFKDGSQVALEQILLAKEQRVAHQQAFIAKYQSAIISLTLVIPGEIKKSSAADYLFQQAMLAIQENLSTHHLTILEQKQYQSVTGNEAIIAVDSPADKLKAHCIELEINHHLGRLWDIDVIDPKTLKSVSRTQFSYPVRLCLICGNEAKTCSRSRKHSIDDLLEVMLKIIYHKKEIK